MNKLEHVEFHTIVSKRRGENLVVDNYLFKKNKRRDHVQYYKCVKKNCSSRLSIDLFLNTIINQPGIHNHFRPEDEIAKQELKTGKIVVDNSEFSSLN